MKTRNHDWRSDFPLREEAEDFSGKTRTFLIDCYEAGLGFTVRAQEQGAEENGFSACENFPASGREDCPTRRFALRNEIVIDEAVGSACGLMWLMWFWWGR